ncbi:MAG TPA: hypothetical protein VFW78_04530 [Bacteroidia bacterium]|nr:hypothetical protein [Bacteroidia bacterium]
MIPDNNSPVSDPLKDLLNPSYLESPPQGFTGRVMDRISTTSPSLISKPVISTGGWVFTLVLVVMVWVIGTHLPSGSQIYEFPQLSSAINTAKSFESLLSGSTISILFFITTAGLLFLLADSAIRKRRIL